MPANPFEQLGQWWSTQLDWRQTPTLWVLASFLAGVAATNMLWLILTSQRQAASWLRQRLETPVGHASAWLLRMAWLIGPGYAALLVGAASPRLMGLSQIDWGAGLGFGTGFAVLALAILLAAGLSYRRSLPAQPPWPSFAAAIAGSAVLCAEAGALQFHWAFYRSAVIEGAETLGAAAPLVAGTWLSVALIGLEGGLSPLFWRDLRTPGRAERRVLRAGLLLATSVLYLLSRNFWLAWALHATAIVLLEPRLVSVDPQASPGAGSTHSG